MPLHITPVPELGLHLPLRITSTYLMCVSCADEHSYMYPVGVTWKAQNQAAVLLAAGQKGHRYTFPHAKISTAPPIMNRVFGQTVDAQLQVMSERLNECVVCVCVHGGGDVSVWGGVWRESVCVVLF